MSDNIKLNASEWGVKTEERTKGRMKLTFKLNQEESTSYKNWATVVKPAEVDENRFLKTIFLRGIASLNEEMRSIADQQIAKEKLEKQKADALASQPQEPAPQQA